MTREAFQPGGTATARRTIVDTQGMRPMLIGDPMGMVSLSALNREVHGEPT